MLFQLFFNPYWLMMMFRDLFVMLRAFSKIFQLLVVSCFYSTDDDPSSLSTGDTILEINGIPVSNKNIKQV